MKYSDFDFFYNNIIKTYCNEMQQLAKDKNKNGAILLCEYKKKMIYHYYESFRKDIRSLYMTGQSNPMDRHKIAANMMFSIIKSKIIKIDRTVADLTPPLLMANEYVALFTAINIVEIYKRKNTGVQNYKIIIPKTYIQTEDGRTDSYLENVCKALYYTKRIRISDILGYANILFLLEKYTDTIK